MANMKKKNLGFKDYNWKAVNDNPGLRGKVERDQLNRKQGYEVLYFVNFFLEKYMLTEPETGRKIERLLRSEVPKKLKNRHDIEKWLVENWG